MADKSHSGCRCNQITISGDENNAMVNSVIDVLGITETSIAPGTIPVLPVNWNKLYQAEIGDMSIQIDSTQVDWSSWQLAQNNQVITKYLGQKSPKMLPRTSRQITFQIKPPKQSNTWDVEWNTFTVAEHTLTITIKALHNGTGVSGTFTQAVITCPRIKLELVDEDIKFEDLGFSPLTFRILKPDSATDSLAIAYSNV